MNIPTNETGMHLCCRQCGKALRGHVRFCPFCRTEEPAVPSNPQTPTPASRPSPTSPPVTDSMPKLRTGSSATVVTALIVALAAGGLAYWAYLLHEGGARVTSHSTGLSLSPTTAPPAASAPVVRAGDRWVTEVIDHTDARLSYRAERVVQSVSSGRIVTTVRTLKSGYTRTIEYNGHWGLLLTRLPNGGTTTYTPALPYLEFPARLGRAWQAEVTESTSGGATRTHSVRAIVGDWEIVTVPAGTFKAIRVDLQDDISENGTVVHRGRDSSWYVPEVRRTVKTEESSFNPVSGERRRRTIALIEYAVH